MAKTVVPLLACRKRTTVYNTVEYSAVQAKAPQFVIAGHLSLHASGGNKMKRRRRCRLKSGLLPSWKR